ncbi:MAG: sugar ABC transporter permease [Clostridiales bacterium]|nr:sugar ABC transporter permease [Clostridiales bacterium]
MSRLRPTKEGAFLAFWRGDGWIKLTAPLWGAGFIARGQLGKGLLLFAEEAALLLGIILTLPALMKLPTLGTVQAERIWDPVTRRNVWNDYDNSFLILLFGVTGLLLILTFLVQCGRMVKDARRTQLLTQTGHDIPTLRHAAAQYLGPRFHRTLLLLPVIGVILVMVIPLIVMILIAFTNYDRAHLVPTNLLSWVGIDNFLLLTGLTSRGAFAYAFPRVLGWTLLWAVTATLSCYIGGILLAMFINHRRTRWKSVYRTCFMAAMAVPQFVSLLLVRNLFADVGIVNTLLREWGVTDWLHHIGAIPTAGYVPFLTHPTWARGMILTINLWVGVPWQMLVATGVLLNIPRELTEAARIDGANGLQVFRRITLPYLLHITGPSLISGMVTNINNFNVIWLLTREVYVTADQTMAAAGATEVDLLVTWLYRLTQDQSNYKMASVIGILVFAVCSAITLTAFIRLTREGKEAAFR